MPVNKRKCEKCNKEISLSNFNKHSKCCKGFIKKDWFINVSKEYECKICGKKSTKSGIGNHIKYHYGYKNPKLGHKAWNKDLTKENSEGLKKLSISIIKGYKTGKIKPVFFGKKHTEETRKKWKQNPNMGGLREGSGLGIKGWYREFYCRSTWELAWIVFQIESNISVLQNKDYFVYSFEGENHKYFPDFIINNVYYEIKGYRNKNVEAKIEQFPKEKKLILIEGKKEIKPFIDYCEKKYGKKFWEVLYKQTSEFAVSGGRAD